MRVWESSSKALRWFPKPSTSCIAVTLNDRLDYFGSTVNIAARIQGLATGGDIAVSDVVWQDPDVQMWWRETSQAQHIDVRCTEAMLKGIDGLFVVWHIAETPLAKEMT